MPIFPVEKPSKKPNSPRQRPFRTHVLGFGFWWGRFTPSFSPPRLGTPATSAPTSGEGTPSFHRSNHWGGHSVALESTLRGGSPCRSDIRGWFTPPVSLPHRYSVHPIRPLRRTANPGFPLGQSLGPSLRSLRGPFRSLPLGSPLRSFFGLLLALCFTRFSGCISGRILARFLDRFRFLLFDDVLFVPVQQDLGALHPVGQGQIAEEIQTPRW